MADQATEKAESLEEAFSILSCYTYDAAGVEMCDRAMGLLTS